MIAIAIAITMESSSFLHELIVDRLIKGMIVVAALAVLALGAAVIRWWVGRRRR
ncbi:hypothetical protein ACFY2W_09235 [Streptomyces sp. NPDC001262]|uniref:hypothetical protein n=1 Tax=unclassified Streptomyces TaxID=2593676 RepID=UPI0036C04A37